MNDEKNGFFVVEKEKVVNFLKVISKVNLSTTYKGYVFLEYFMEEFKAKNINTKCYASTNLRTNLSNSIIQFNGYCKVCGVTKELQTRKNVTFSVRVFFDESCNRYRFYHSTTNSNHSNHLSKFHDHYNFNITHATINNTIKLLMHENQIDLMNPIRDSIKKLKEKKWTNVEVSAIKTTLESLLNQMKEMPDKLRQNDSYNSVKNLLQNYLEKNLLIVDLKSEALKEKHWKQLMNKMNVAWNFNSLTLGQVWDINLSIYEGIIKEMVLKAKGEKALEEFLKQVSELWKNYTLELINYQNKCQIIGGWDDLFNKLEEHINSVKAMNSSQYYKEFEKEALS